MSCWTTVRIIYDLEKKMPYRNGKIYDEDKFYLLDLPQLYESAKATMQYDEGSIYNLGQEGSVKINLIANRDSSILSRGTSISISKSGQLVMIGDLRGVEREEFIEALNQWKKTLREFGISITDALVGIY